MPCIWCYHFFHSSGSELVLTTLKPDVVHTGGDSGTGMSKAFLLEFCMEQATIYTCTLWQSGNISTTIQVIGMSFSSEGEVWSPSN